MADALQELLETPQRKDETMTNVQTLEAVKPAPPKPRSKLKAVDPKTAEPSKPKILIYGKPGVGKTWASLDFPNVYYIDTEGGANLGHYTDKLKASGGAYLGPEQGSLDFDTVISQIQALATEEHGYKTLVIDSISKLFNVSIADEAERLGDKDAWGASKKPAVSAMRRLVSWLTRIDMNVILIAHEKPEWGVDGKGQRVEIGATFDCWATLEYELHLCLNIIKAGPARNAKIRKSRLIGFPDGEFFKWGYKEFAEKYGKDVIEKEGKQITLATPEQIKKIRTLLNVVKLPEGQLEKWLQSANASSLEEIEQCKAQKIIDHINDKYINKGEE